ncbi:MAG: alpha/beta hydrolase [Aeromicrobium sp.]
MLARFNLGVVAIMAGIILLAAFVMHQRTDEPLYPRPTGERGPAGLAEFYSQKLVWKPCAGVICTWVLVPLDYDKPDGETIKLRVKLRPSDSNDPKGRLFINPGGPGGSGVDYVNAFAGQTSKDVRSAYEIIGFDPRGVGRSAPLTCLSNDAFGEVIRFDPDPDDQEEASKLEEGFRSIGEACVKESGPLASHVSTAENARDLDVLRALVGERDLNFYGASYGTQLGATYADMFPKSVGSMVLDGGVDLTLSKERQAYGQALGFERALQSFLRNCMSEVSCPLGKDLEASENMIVKLLRALDSKPIKTRGKRTLTENGAIHGIAFALYDRRAWGVLATGLQRAAFGDGTVLLALSDEYFGRKSDGSYRNNGAQAVYAIRCLDYPKAPSRAKILQSEKSYNEASPVFGRVMAWSAAECRDWPVQSTTPQGRVTAEGAPPILVVGSTRDPATPYAWSKALAGQLKSGVLVTRKGDGHTGYGVGNRCVDDVVDNYLVAGKNPRGRVNCG